jgi:hypothetical protein
MEKDCFGHIDPQDQKCVPHCQRFIECYNEQQRQVHENMQKVITL